MNFPPHDLGELARICSAGANIPSYPQSWRIGPGEPEGMRVAAGPRGRDAMPQGKCAVVIATTTDISPAPLRTFLHGIGTGSGPAPNNVPIRPVISMNPAGGPLSRVPIGQFRHSAGSSIGAVTVSDGVHQFERVWEKRHRGGDLKFTNIALVRHDDRLVPVFVYQPTRRSRDHQAALSCQTADEHEDAGKAARSSGWGAW